MTGNFSFRAQAFDRIDEDRQQLTITISRDTARSLLTAAALAAADAEMPEGWREWHNRSMLEFGAAYGRALEDVTKPECGGSS